MVFLKNTLQLFHRLGPGCEPILEAWACKGGRPRAGQGGLCSCRAAWVSSWVGAAAPLPPGAPCLPGTPASRGPLPPGAPPARDPLPGTLLPGTLLPGPHASPGPSSQGPLPPGRLPPCHQPAQNAVGEKKPAPSFQFCPKFKLFSCS